jgi:thioredoxin family protein
MSLSISKVVLQNAIAIVLAVCVVIVTASLFKPSFMRGSQSQQAVVRRVSDWMPLIAGRNPTVGFPSAPVKIIEFSDYECSACRSLEQNLHLLYQLEPMNVMLIRYNFPLTNIHPHAYAAALAASCAEKQNVYEPYQRALFTRDFSDFHQESWTELAKNTGVPDVRSFSRCVAEQHTKASILSDEEIGKKLGIEATPTLIINGDVVVGSHSVEALRKVVGDALARTNHPATKRWVNLKQRLYELIAAPTRVDQESGTYLSVITFSRRPAPQKGCGTLCPKSATKF